MVRYGKFEVTEKGCLLLPFMRSISGAGRKSEFSLPVANKLLMVMFWLFRALKMFSKFLNGGAFDFEHFQLTVIDRSLCHDVSVP